MRTNATAKTVSARKFQALFLDSSWVVIAAVLTLAGFGFFARGLPHQQVQIGSKHYDLRVAATASSWARGLSGERQLAPDQGMLFVFDKPDIRCMWMKDMHIPLDMLWLNHDKIVTHIEENISPETYPKNYCPPDKAQYVIELDAGQASSAGIFKGERITF